jgi:hypothetical protein
MSLKINESVKQPDSFGSAPQNCAQRSCILGAAQAGPVTQTLNLPSGREISVLPFAHFTSDITLPQSSFTQTIKSQSDEGAQMHTVRMFDLAITLQTPTYFFVSDFIVFITAEMVISYMLPNCYLFFYKNALFFYFFML